MIANNLIEAAPPLPWAMPFSFGCARQALYHRAKRNWATRVGSYNSQMENTSV